ncbi:MAG TPA: hypothetical protein VFT90_13060 [Chryseosolibacter sp.]|nr:hypothetical protein [Chryseosolibacter sp.]
MKSRKDILKDILISAETGCVVKLKLKNLRNPVITAVERISNKSILLKPTCLYGYPLEKRTISLLDIEGIKRYKTYFDHPLFARLRYIKNNLSEVRKNLATLGSQRGERLAT